MSKSILGIKFAPFDIPLERRLQTLAVLYLSLSFVLFIYGGIILSLYCLFYTDYYYLSILYYIWYWYDHKTCFRGGRRFNWIRNVKLWHYFRDYFPVRTIKTAELDPNKNYVCGYHPHGIVSIGAFTSFATEATGFSKIFKRIKPYLLTLNIQFAFPFYCDYLMSLGMCSVSKESISWLLTNEGKGNMLVIVVGGALEALDAHPGFAKLILRRRKGFVRLAIKHGASLVPIFSFGENELYSQVSNPTGSGLRAFQNFATRMLTFTLPVFYGRGVFQYSFGTLPYRKPVDVIVGKPIDVEQNPNPSPNQVDHFHNLYIDGLRQLFDEYKRNYENYKNTTLEFVG